MCQILSFSVKMATNWLIENQNNFDFGWLILVYIIFKRIKMDKNDTNIKSNRFKLVEKEWLKLLRTDWFDFGNFVKAVTTNIWLGLV